MARDKWNLSRRAVLKGIGGAAVALPLLELMADNKAYAQTVPIPRRYLVCFGGQSMGADNDPLHNDYVPDTVGYNYDLKTALAPFAGYNDIRNEISVVSDLKIPSAYDNAGQIPAGGRPVDFHVSTASPLLSGTRSSSNSASCNGATSDQLVADAIGQGTTFRSLVYRIQAAWYLSVSAPYGRDLLSYKKDSTGRIVPVPATVSPKQAFDSLFGNFAPATNTAELDAARVELSKRRSVLDLVRGSTERLMGRVGAQDKLRLQRHFDEIRALELRIQDLPPPATGSCVAPADPGADPAVGGNLAGDFATNSGYSNEDQRAKVFADLIHMAFACDLTRSASLMFTMFQSHMNMYVPAGVPNDLHEIGHSGMGTVTMAKAQAWHMKHFAYLVSKFRDTPEGNGTMLDNMAIVFLHEGGHGLDPSSGKQNSSHSSERMACLIAGRAGGLKPGKHVVASGKHPANVLVSAMKAVGVNTNQLGEVTGDLPELFTA